MDIFILLVQFTLIVVTTVVIPFIATTLLSGKSLRDELSRIGGRRDDIEQRWRMQVMRARLLLRKRNASTAPPGRFE